MKTFVFCFILAFCGVAKAQLLDFGVKAGANFANLKLNGGSQITDVRTQNCSGFHFGTMLRINVLQFYVQPELLYTRTKAEFAFKTVLAPKNGTYVLQRIDVPIHVGIKLGPLALFAGPIASFAISSPSQIYDDSYKKATWGYQAGVGIKLASVLAEVKYEGAFSDQAKKATINGTHYNLDARQSMVILSLGHFF